MGAGGRCAVVGCRVKIGGENTKENGISLFKVPKASLDEWKLLIPSSSLESNSRVCSRHFDEADILKGRTIGNTFFSFKRWQLKTGARPKHLLNVDEPTPPPYTRPKNQRQPLQQRNNNLQGKAGTSKVLQKDPTVGLQFTANNNLLASTKPPSTTCEPIGGSNRQNLQVAQVNVERNCLIELQSNEQHGTEQQSGGMDDAEECGDLSIEDPVNEGDASHPVDEGDVSLGQTLPHQCLTQPMSGHLSNNFEFPISDVGVDLLIEDQMDVDPVLKVTVESELNNLGGDHVHNDTTIDTVDDIECANVSSSSSQDRMGAGQPLTSDPRTTTEDTTGQRITTNDENVSNFKANFNTYLSLTTLVKLPSEWYWSYSNTEKVIYVINVNPTTRADGSLLIRTVRIKDSQILSYHYHGDVVYPIGLAHTFTSYEHLGELISAFGLTKPCATITERSLIQLAMASSTRLPYRQNKHGDVESSYCQIVAYKGRQCMKCRNLKGYLMKQKKVYEKRANKCKRQYQLTLKWRMNAKQHKLDECRRKIRSLERKAKTTSVLVKELRRDYRILVAEARRNSLDHNMSRLAETVMYSQTSNLVLLGQSTV